MELIRNLQIIKTLRGESLNEPFMGPLEFQKESKVEDQEIYIDISKSIFLFTSRKAGQNVLVFQVMTFVYLIGRGRLAFLKILGLLICLGTPHIETFRHLHFCP